MLTLPPIQTPLGRQMVESEIVVIFMVGLTDIDLRFNCIELSLFNS